MIRLIQAAAVCLALLPSGARADVEELFDVMRLDEIIEVMRKEGLDYGAEMAVDFLNGAGGPDWERAVNRIYDTDKMAATVLENFSASLADVDTDILVAYFEGETGAEIISLEISAREALLDDAIEEASILQLEAAEERNDPRLDLIGRYIEKNDLIESNVVGALNSNFAFFTGLADGGAFPFEMTEEQIIRDVWQQEAEIRADTTEWIRSFLLMAYQPLSDDQIEEYIALSDTPEGSALNRALFESFNEMFNEISRSLGLAASIYMGGQEL